MYIDMSGFLRPGYIYTLGDNKIATWSFQGFNDKQNIEIIYITCRLEILLQIIHNLSLEDSTCIHSHSKVNSFALLWSCTTNFMSLMG